MIFPHLALLRIRLPTLESLGEGDVDGFRVGGGKEEMSGSCVTE